MLERVDASQFAGGSSRGGAVARGAASEATLGFGDEIAGAVEGGLTDKSIPEATAQYRAADEIAKMNRPDYYTGGQVAGAVGSALIPGAAAARLTRAGAGLGRRALASGAAGAATEGTRAAGHTQGGQTGGVRDLLQGTAIGAAGGAIAPPVGALAGRLGGAVMRGIRNTPVPGANPRSADELLNIVRQDATGTGRTLQDVGKQLDAYGPEATLADAGGSYGVAAGEAARAAGPQGSGLARLVADRLQGAPGRIQTSLDQNIAPAGRRA